MKANGEVVRMWSSRDALVLKCSAYVNDRSLLNVVFKWLGSAKRDLDAMPEDVKDVFGHAIDLAQAGDKHQDAKVLAGFGSAGVLEVVEDSRVDTYPAVYKVRFTGWVYVLHCFQKKAKSGIKTPKKDLDLIRARLMAATRDFEAWRVTQGAQQ